MKFAVSVANLEEYSDPRLMVQLAQDAEAAGWDGFFIWDSLLFEAKQSLKVGEAWISLAAIAVNTQRIRIGPTITALPRRRPWKVAREAATLDQLSNGRLILAVGLGFQPEADFQPFREDMDNKVRAAKLDESLKIMTGLWTGQPFSHDGHYYHVDQVTFLPKPVQLPRIPIWLTGQWPNKPPFQRAARWDGIMPAGIGDGSITPNEIKDCVAYIQSRRNTDAPFDVVRGGDTPGDDPGQATDIVESWREAGVTWWLEYIYPWRGPLEDMRRRIRQGPPINS